MRLRYIQTRILALLVLICALFLTTLFGTLNWVRRQMDDRAATDSMRLVAAHFDADRESLSTITTDYAHWELAYDQLMRADLRWAEENFGITARLGQTFDRVAIFGGPIPNVWTWGKDGPSRPSAAYVPYAVIQEARLALAEPTLDIRDTVDFVGIANGQAVFFSASYILPVDEAVIDGLDRKTVPMTVIGRSLTLKALAGVSGNLILSDLTITHDPPGGRPLFALIDSDGKPVAYVSWSAPDPGTELLDRILPFLALISVAFIAFAITLAQIAQRNALRLIKQELLASQTARTEPLTGLPNRLSFMEHIQSFEHLSANRLAILYIDLNGFKKINDTVGHAGGDEVVAELGRRLIGMVDAHRFLARIGGDEFVYIVTDDVDVSRPVLETSVAVAQALKPAFFANGQRFEVTAAQGISIKDAENLSIDELMRRADLAMYHAKRAALTEAQSYNEDIETISQEDRIIEKALRQGLAAEDEFTVQYQPIVDAKTGSLIRAEALARWRSSTIGVVGPDRFIRVAETAGLIPALGKVLINRICLDMAACPDIKVAINISPLQLRAPDFVQALERSFLTLDIDPGRVEIELTEGVIVENADLAAYRLELLHDAGFTTALDDFGTGFSSIGYLRNLPFDTLKIDRSFLNSDPISQRNCELIRSIIHLGHSFGQKVVCEGVETEDQARQLRAIGCDQFQGYLFGRPMPLADFIEAFPVLLRSSAA